MARDVKARTEQALADQNAAAGKLPDFVCSTISA